MLSRTVLFVCACVSMCKLKYHMYNVHIISYDTVGKACSISETAAERFISLYEAIGCCIVISCNTSNSTKIGYTSYIEVVEVVLFKIIIMLILYGNVAVGILQQQQQQ